MEKKDLANVVMTEHDVNGLIVNVWHPMNGSAGFSISLKSGGWLIGSYDSVESALVGAECDLSLTTGFYEMQKRVNHFDREDRLISIEDLNLLKGVKKRGVTVSTYTVNSR